MVAKKKEDLRCTVSCETDVVMRDEPFTMTLRVKNDSPATRHVSCRIHSYRIDEDNSVLEVSTALPQLADTVHPAVFRLETRPIEPGASLDEELAITLPIRATEIVAGAPGSGAPLQTRVSEWLPEGEFEVRLEVAFGDQPFYSPPERAKFDQAVKRWTSRIRAAPMTLRVQQRGGTHGVD